MHTNFKCSCLRASSSCHGMLNYVSNADLNVSCPQCSFSRFQADQECKQLFLIQSAPQLEALQILQHTFRIFAKRYSNTRGVIPRFSLGRCSRSTVSPSIVWVFPLPVYHILNIYSDQLNLNFTFATPPIRHDSLAHTCKDQPPGEHKLRSFAMLKKCSLNG